MLVLCELVLDGEELVVENVLRINIFDKDPETLSKPVHCFFELEVRRDGQLNSEDGASNRQHVCS